MTPGPAAKDDADWQILARLFGDGAAAFRHRMGVSPGDVRAFYRSTAAAAAIRQEKAVILASAEADRYFVETEAGDEAARELARLLDLDDPAAPSGRALTVALTLALEPDWLLLASPDWRLTWASVCFPTRWSLAGRAGQPLPDIHAAVPGLNSELGRKIDVFFARLHPDEGWTRANWGLSASAARNQHPGIAIPELTAQTPITAVQLRVESQLFCKLPETGAIAFGIRILNFPLLEVLADSTLVPGLRSQLQTMPAEVAAYKGIPADFWRRLT